MGTRQTDLRLTDQELAAMARVAGLPISADWLPGLRREMIAAMIANREMDSAVRRASAPGGEPFDASWQSEQKGRRA